MCGARRGARVHAARNSIRMDSPSTHRISLTFGNRNAQQKCIKSNFSSLNDQEHNRTYECRSRIVDAVQTCNCIVVGGGHSTESPYTMKCVALTLHKYAGSAIGYRHVCIHTCTMFRKRQDDGGWPHFIDSRCVLWALQCIECTSPAAIDMKSSVAVCVRWCWYQPIAVCNTSIYTKLSPTCQQSNGDRFSTSFLFIFSRPVA